MPSGLNQTHPLPSSLSPPPSSPLLPLPSFLTWCLIHMQLAAGRFPSCRWSRNSSSSEDSRKECQDSDLRGLVAVLQQSHVQAQLSTGCTSTHHHYAINQMNIMWTSCEDHVRIMWRSRDDHVRIMWGSCEDHVTALVKTPDQTTIHFTRHNTCIPERFSSKNHLECRQLVKSSADLMGQHTTSLLPFSQKYTHGPLT